MQRLTTLLMSLVFLLSFVNSGMAAENKLAISPEKVAVGLNFKGTALTISGDVPDNAAVYVKVSSPNDSILDLAKKGKVSLFWLNVENTSVTKVPKLYHVLSSQPLSEIPQELQKELGIDPNFSSLYGTAVVSKHGEKNSIELKKPEAKEYINSLVAIYKKSDLYGINENAVQIKDGHFATSLKLPANIPQEKCDVTVYFMKNGKVIGTSARSFNVETVGVVKWLDNLAIYDGPSYGFMSVMIALVVGAGIAFLFIYLEYRKNSHAPLTMDSGAGH